MYSKLGFPTVSLATELGHYNEYFLAFFLPNRKKKQFPRDFSTLVFDYNTYGLFTGDSSLLPHTCYDDIVYKLYISYYYNIF